MTENSAPRVVFMGTSDFAVCSLQALLDAKVPVIGVYTQPDRPKGRGRKLNAPPVKQLALELGIPVCQPNRLRDAQAVQSVRDLHPDLIVVTSYGQILPQAVLDIPPLGCINVHASLLPRYRGASPVNRALMDGEQVTGVTTMLMDAGLDTGAMLLSGELKIDFEETAGQLEERLAQLGGEVLIETIHRLRRGELDPKPQDDALSSYAPLLKKEDGLIDWSFPAMTLHNRVRGLDPWPGAFTRLRDVPLKIYRTLPVTLETEPEGVPGQVLSADSSGLCILCGEGALLVREAQLPGRNRLKIGDFLRGARIAPGEILS